MLNVEQVNLAADTSFRIVDLEEVNLTSIFHLHRHDYFEVIWFENIDNNTFHTVDFIDLKINKNDILILTPNQIHAFKNTKLKGYVLQFSKDYFIDLLGASHPYSFSIHHFHFNAQQEVILPIRLLIKLLLTEYNTTNRNELITLYLKALLRHLSELQNRQTVYVDEAEKEIVNKVFKLVDANYRQKKKLLFYTDQLNINQRSLNALVMKHTGVSLKQFIYNRTALEAKRMLYTNNLLVKEIAYELGFKDISHFNKFFSKQVGQTPLDFRKSHQSQFRQ